MKNAFAAPTWLFEGAYQWILVCGQGFPYTDDWDPEEIRQTAVSAVFLAHAHSD